MKTSQHNMTSTLSTLAYLRMKQWQWKCHPNNSVLLRKSMDNFVMSLPLFNPLQSHHPASQLYTPRTHVAFQPDAHYRYVSIPSQLTRSVWNINHPTISHNNSHYTHLPRRDLKIYYNAEANSHLMTTPSLQCYNAQLQPIPTL